MPQSTCWSLVHRGFSALIVFEHTFSVALLSGASAVRWSMRKPLFAARFCTTSDWFLLTGATIGLRWMGADAARQFCSKHQVAPERADLVWKAIALHTSPGIATRLADEVALVHLGAGLELLGLRLDQVPPQVVEEVLERYPRMNFKSEIRNLLVEHCWNNPAAQVLNWTDDVGLTAGCKLQGQPIPTASQLMSAAPYDE